MVTVVAGHGAHVSHRLHHAPFDRPEIPMIIPVELGLILIFILLNAWNGRNQP
jgi:hypothetical protein